MEPNVSISNNMFLKTSKVFNSAPHGRHCKGIWASLYGLSISQILSRDGGAFKVVFKEWLSLFQQKLPFWCLIDVCSDRGSPPNTYFETIPSNCSEASLSWFRLISSMIAKNGIFLAGICAESWVAIVEIESCEINSHMRSKSSCL